MRARPPARPSVRPSRRVPAFVCASLGVRETAEVCRPRNADDCEASGPKMEKNHYHSGSFDGLSDAGHHLFKSSFAKSMALETTKSLNFDLDFTAGNDRYNTIGSSRRQVKVPLIFFVTSLDLDVDYSSFILTPTRFPRIRESESQESHGKVAGSSTRVKQCFWEVDLRLELLIPNIFITLKIKFDILSKTKLFDRKSLYFYTLPTSRNVYFFRLGMDNFLKLHGKVWEFYT